MSESETEGQQLTRERTEGIFGIFVTGYFDHRIGTCSQLSQPASPAMSATHQNRNAHSCAAAATCVCCRRKFEYLAVLCPLLSGALTIPLFQLLVPIEGL